MFSKIKIKSISESIKKYFDIFHSSDEYLKSGIYLAFNSDNKIEFKIIDFGNG